MPGSSAFIVKVAVAAMVAWVLVLAVAPTAQSVAVSPGADESDARTTEAVALRSFPAGGAAASMSSQPDMMDGDDRFWSGGWWIVMPIMMLVFWAVVLAVAVWGIRQFTGRRDGGRSALEIARERLAKGEMTKEEFDHIRGDLA